MSKRISQNVRKKVACALVTSMVIGSSCNLASADNGFDNASYKDIGYISVAGEVGIHGNAGFISTGEGDAGGKSYGVSQFTSKGGGASANGFVKWLKKAYPEMGKNFDGVGRAGSSSFDNAWKKTYNENKDEFGRVQMEYTGKNYVDPFVSKAKSEFGVDFKSTRALLELAYSTTVQFGVKGTMDVFRNAGINSSMSEIEILENATAEKIRSVGTYKFLGCSQNIRNGVRKRFAREIKEFKDIVEGTANIKGEGAITLDDLVNGNTNNTKPSLDDLVSGETDNKEDSSLDDLVNGETDNKEDSSLDDLVNGETDNTDSSLDDLVNGETDNTDSSLDDLVNGETDNTDSSLDDLVNGETDNKEDSPLDDLVNGETDNKEDSPLDDLVNGDVDSADKEPTTEGDNKEEVDSEIDSNEPTVEDDSNEPTVEDESKEDDKKEDSPLDDLVNGEPSEENDKETNVDNTVDSNEEVSTENKPSSDKESTLDDLVTEDDTEKDDADSDENTQDTPNEDTDSSVEEEPVKEEPVKEELVEEPSLDNLVNGEPSEESNKTEDNSSNEIKEDTSDDKPTEDDKKEITEDDKSIEDNKNNTTEDDKSIEDSKDEVENTTPTETAIQAETVSSLEEKLENNMFGKLFKITKEIMENENGVDGVKAMYDLI